MEPIYLILSFSVLFFYTFLKVVKKDIFFGGAYLFLFIYTIFTQIGYAYFPELSVILKAYFGETLFKPYLAFVALSFFAFYIVFLLLFPKLSNKTRYEVVQTRPMLKGVLFYELILIHLVFMTFYFISNYDILNYVNVADEDFFKSNGLLYVLFIIGFKFSIVINLLLYVLFRARKKFGTYLNSFIIPLMLVSECLLLVLISWKIGSRTDLLALTLGVIIFEIKASPKTRRDKRKILFRLAVFVLAVLMSLTILEYTRTESTADDKPLMEVMLYKDYYPPSHILIAAIEYNFVNFGEVLKSNISNSLLKMNYPYLQATVTDLFNPDISTRSASYAFYIFSEGFIAVGWFGFLYNAIIVFLGLSIWRSLALSNHEYYNLFVIALISTQLANIVRSQSSYFVKDLYTIFLPGVLLFYLATGLRPKIVDFLHTADNRRNVQVDSL